MKKLVLNLSCALLLSTAITNITQANSLESASGWASGFLQTAITYEIVPSEMQSNYTQAITRVEFCQLAAACYEKAVGYEISERVTFSDTNDVSVEKMAGIGIISGTSKTTFEPDIAINREQAAVILSALHGKLINPLADASPSFDDNDLISTWAVKFVGQVSQAAIMGGVGYNQFAPKDTYSREQSITTLLKIFELAMETSAEDLNKAPMSDAEFASLLVVLATHVKTSAEYGTSILSASSLAVDNFVKYSSNPIEYYINQMNNYIYDMKTASAGAAKELNELAWLCGDIQQLSQLKVYAIDAMTHFEKIANNTYDPYGLQSSNDRDRLRAMSDFMEFAELILEGSPHMENLSSEVSNFTTYIG